MKDAPTPDLCVIGASPAGLAAAVAVAAGGGRAIVIDKGEIDGERIAAGRVATPALVAAAAAAQAARSAARFGVRAEPEVDFAAVMAHVRDRVRAAAPDYAEPRLRALGVEIVRAPAHFVSRRDVEAGGRRIRAARYVVAMGAEPTPPKIAGLEQIRLETPAGVFGLEAPPQHLVVLGAGRTGLVLGQAFRRLGVAATVIGSGRALPGEDEEFGELVAAALARDGVDLRLHAGVTRAEATTDGFRLHLADGPPVEGTHLLLATRRRLPVEELGLAAAGVRPRRHGVLAGNRRISFPDDPAVSRGGVALLDPEIARVGLSEAEARKAVRRIRVLRWPVAWSDRARAEALQDGHAKVVLAADGRVLGATIAARGAGEMIGLWELAVARRLPIDAVAALCPPGPTLGEISARAAQTGLSSEAGWPWLGGLLGVLRKFG